MDVCMQHDDVKQKGYFQCILHYFLDRKQTPHEGASTDEQKFVVNCTKWDIQFSTVRHRITFFSKNIFNTNIEIWTILSVT